MNRRNFLKALGLGSGASAVSACGLDDNRYYTPIEQVLPYVVRPEQVTPGTPTYFATSVGTGPSAYPVLALHREGRITNVVANRQTDAQAAVSTTDLFDLQRHYSPDRIRQPMVDGAPASWDDGLAKLADAVKGARASGKKVVYLGGYRTGSIAALLADKQVRVDRQRSASLAPVEAEWASLTGTVLGNLLSNAIKFSHPGATLHVATALAGPATVTLRIEDEGIGIPDDLRPLLFAPDARTSRVGTAGESGTGFGLPLVAMFLDKYGAGIAVHPGAGPPERPGAAFVLSFPVAGTDGSVSGEG